MNIKNAAEFSGKCALVTGGTTGIGRATAELLHAAGAQVAITGQNADTLAAAARELPSDMAVWRSDARSLADATQLAADVRERFGKLDVLFLNAGIAQLAPFEAVDEAFYQEHMDVNVKGVVFTLQKLLPLLAPGASVVVNTSVADQRGTAGLSIYSASKGAVAALVRALAVELAPRGVRVNSVCPATILTPIQQKFGLTGRRCPGQRTEVRRAHPARSIWRSRRGRPRRTVSGFAGGLLRYRHRAGRGRWPSHQLGVGAKAARRAAADQVDEGDE